MTKKTPASQTAQFAGNPRPFVSPPLERAKELGIQQVLDKHGEPNGDLADPDLPKETLLELYRTMVMVRAIDDRGWKLQRAGRVEFWIPSRGQEASHVASTQAMDSGDWIFMASREPGTMLSRGASLKSLFTQFFGRVPHPLKGRRLPLLMGDRDLRIVPCITVVGSYIPHAAGAAWAAKLRGEETRSIVYFGDGATSRGEFHSAMNFAGVHKPPCVFFCQNNGWAVSTPNDRQTASATFAQKGDAYGVRNLRVDGNDPLAIYALTKEARDGTGEFGASLIEAVTYRVGFHTSSDNPDLYRMPEETAAWVEWDPISRMRGYIKGRGFWSDAEDKELVETYDADIMDAVRAAEAMEEPGPELQFDDVFEEPTWMIEEQRERHLADLNHTEGEK